MGLFLATISLFLISYVKWRFVFDNGNLAAIVIWTSLLLGGIATIFAVTTIRKWASIIALLFVAIVVYLVLFTRLYALS